MRAVVISEPHLNSPFARYGGHQYARIFARHGWRVIMLTASFNLCRLLLSKPGINEAYIDLWLKSGRRIDGNLSEYCLAHFLPAWLRFRPIINRFAPFLYVPTVRSVLKKEGIERVDLLWLHGDHDWLLRKAISHGKLIVRIVDDYFAYNSGYGDFHSLMRETLLSADGVFACSEYVRERFAKLFGIDIQVVPNGVDFEHFSRPVKQEHHLLKSIPRPRITYVGAIAEWFDLDLVIKLARRMPDCSFLLVGKWQREQPAPGEYPKNIYILGPVEYENLPAVLAYSDVGLIPFKNTLLVQGISPIKVYEYLAASLPVVSLRWGQLERECLPIFLASTLAEFEKGVREALAMPAEHRARLREAVRACTWERRLEEMLSYIGLQIDN